MVTSSSGGPIAHRDAAVVPVGGGALPVLAECDLLMLGGTFGAAAVALAAARAGYRVVLAEPRTYLGYETSALLRPWLSAEALSAPPDLFRGWLAEAVPLPASMDEVALYPDAVKLGLEDALLGAGAVGATDRSPAPGVQLLYASQPIGVVFEGQGVAGAVIGNKSGRQAVLARAMVDATDWAVFARLAGAPFHLAPLVEVEVRRTLEFTGLASVRNDLPPEIVVPQRLGLLDGTVRVHRGYLGAGHALVECRYRLPLAVPDLAGRVALEIEVRRRSMDLAAHLVAEHPAFRGAYLAHTSWEAWMASPWQLDGGGPVVPGRPNLFVLGSAAAPAGQAPEALLDPLASAAAGEALAPKVLAVLDTAPLPVPAHCTARCAALGAASNTAATAGPDEGRRTKDESPSSSVLRPSSPREHDLTGSLEVREPRGAQRGRRYELVSEDVSAVPVLADVDVLVVGGGTSGATAAAIAAEAGVRVVLLELNSGLGGTGTVGGVDSYWYGRRVGFTATVDRYYEQEAARLGLGADRSAGGGAHGSRRGPSAHDGSGGGGDKGSSRGSSEASRKWNIEAKMHGLLRWTNESGVALLFRSTVVGTLVAPGPNGAPVPSVRGVLVATPDGLRAILAKVTIDASGDADVAAFAGAQTVYGSARDRLPLWYSLAQFARPGITRNNFTSSVDVGNVADYTRAILAGRRRGEGHDHGVYVAPRESRHIVGDVTLTLTDQLTLRQFPDTVNVCFSNSDIKGKSAAEWVLWGLLPPNVESEIPYRALLPHDLDGVLVCGKAMSCTHDALPAIRMQADLQNLGGACALAAAMAVRAGCSPRDIDVRALQEELVCRGSLPQAVLTRRSAELPLGDEELRTLVEGLTGQEPFYIDMGHDDVQREPLALVRVCTAGPRVVPLLAAAYRQATQTGEAEAAGDPRALLLARLLAWYGAADGLETLAATIEQALAGGTLPGRASKIRHAGLPPDQGAMPEVCYLFFTLGMIRSAPESPERLRILGVLKQIVDLVRPARDDFRDRTKGTFHYVEAVCAVAERLGDRRVVPLLLALHEREGLHDLQATGPEPDFFLERMAYLEVALGRALARCGSPRGVEILVRYLDDARAILAEHAHDELIAISGQDFGKDALAWRRWLAEQSGALRPRPWTARIDYPTSEFKVQSSRFKGARPASTLNVEL